MPEFNKLYTVENIAEMTGLTSRTIRNYLSSGKLKGRKVGGQWRFTQDDVGAFMNTTDMHQSIQQIGEQEMIDFIQSKHTGKEGQICVCTMVDLFLPQQKVAKKCEKICVLFSRESGTSISFRYVYDEALHMGRIVMKASPDLIAEAMQIIQKD